MMVGRLGGGAARSRIQSFPRLHWVRCSTARSGAQRKSEDEEVSRSRVFRDYIRSNFDRIGPVSRGRVRMNNTEI